MNNFFAGAFVAAALAMPGSFGNAPTLVVLPPVMARMAARRVTKMMSYGSFDSCPAVWENGTLNGYVLWNEEDGWKKNSVVELEVNARAMTKSEFDAMFPDLPPLPKGEAT